MRLKEVLITGLSGLCLTCSKPEILKKEVSKKPIEREIVLRDPEGIYKLAFPNPKNYKKLNEQFINHPEYSYNNISKGVMMYFDSNVDSTFDDIPDVIVAYYLRYFDELNGDYEIDSTKAPATIIKNINGDLIPYTYDKDFKMYRRRDELDYRKSNDKNKQIFRRSSF